MNSLKKYRPILFIICNLLLPSCCEDADLKIKSPLNAWMPYANQQEIHFLNETGDTVLFQATIRNFKQQATDKACGSYDIETIEATLATPTDPNVKTIVIISHEIVVSIKVINQSHQATGLDIKFNTVSEQFISFDWRDKYLEEMPLNGKTYKQVLHIYGNYIPGDLAFSDILYAKEKGIIGFKTFSGGWYLLK